MRGLFVSDEVFILGLHHPAGRASETVGVGLEVPGAPGNATQLPSVVVLRSRYSRVRLLD